MNIFYSNLRHDLFAAIVIFLIAIPLCLGIALASGAPLISGIISGIIGGSIVSFFSQSRFSVTGPAAGLALVVLNSIGDLGGIDIFLVSVVIAGVIQIAMSFLKVGNLGVYFPSPVIKGMLSGIGIILIFQQIPHLVGYVNGPFADETSFLSNPIITVENIYSSFKYFSLSAITVSLISLTILIGWTSPKVKKNPFLSMIPAPLVCVVMGIIYTVFTNTFFPHWTLSSHHIVNLPTLTSFDQLIFPKWSELTNVAVYKVAFTLAIIASLESILSIEAVQKLDPAPRIISPNRELLAQGIGNICSGLVGGLPVSAVIVRSSANINAGAKTKNSAIFHGVLLLMSILFMAPLLNLIPLASLASVLFITGYKLADVHLIKEIYNKGLSQFFPFAVTVSMIVLTDLLTGMIIGIGCGLLYILYNSHRSNVIVTNQGNNYLIRMQKDVSFLNKGIIRKHFAKIPEKSFVIIDGQRADYIDHDIIETIDDFSKSAGKRDIKVTIKNVYPLSTQYGKANDTIISRI